LPANGSNEAALLKEPLALRFAIVDDAAVPCDPSAVEKDDIDDDDDEENEAARGGEPKSSRSGITGGAVEDDHDSLDMKPPSLEGGGDDGSKLVLEKLCRVVSLAADGTDPKPEMLEFIVERKSSMDRDDGLLERLTRCERLCARSSTITAWMSPLASSNTSKTRSVVAWITKEKPP
jgi:hypothetical protein